MEKIIGLNQCNFIPSRHNLHNIVAAQKAIQTMKSKKGKIGFMAIKVDLEKAYDSLHWQLLQNTLKDIGLNEHFTSLIMHCVFTCNMYVVLNGELIEKF